MLQLALLPRALARGLAPGLLASPAMALVRPQVKVVAEQGVPTFTVGLAPVAGALHDGADASEQVLLTRDRL